MNIINEKLTPILWEIGIDENMIPEEAYLIEDIGIKRQELAWLLLRLEVDFGVETPVKYWQKRLSLGKIKEFLSQTIAYN